MSTILPHMVCGLSANLECMSEMCCTRLAENTGRKNRHFGTIAQLCLALSSERRHVSTIEKKTWAISSPHDLIMWWTSAYWRLRSVGEFGAPLQISTGLASCLSYSQTDFDVFAPQGRHVAPMGVKFGMEERTPNFIPIGATIRVQDSQNWHFYWDLMKMWNINAPQGHMPCAIFTNFAQFATSFRLR